MSNFSISKGHDCGNMPFIYLLVIHLFDMVCSAGPWVSLMQIISGEADLP